MFKYLYQGASHTDTSVEYMQQLGMDQEQIDSVLAQKEFEEKSAIPKSVTRRQAKQMLAILGKLNDVQPAIDAIQDDQQRALAEIYWNESYEFIRDNLFLNQLGEAIGMTQTDLDNYFIEASKL